MSGERGSDGGLFSEFLEELQAADEFFTRERDRLDYVDKSDPDIRRLIESVAFFSTRTRRLSSERFDRAFDGLARAWLDELLTFQPSRAMLQAQPGPRLTNATVLPPGTAVRMAEPDGAVARFTLMRALSILPVTLTRCEVELRGSYGSRVTLTLRARVPVTTPRQPLSIFLDYLCDYLSSVRFAHALRRNLERVSVTYDTDEPSAAKGYVGRPERPVDEPAPHPIAAIRSFLHFPQQDLFLNVKLPERRRPWRTMQVHLDLNSDWPRSMTINRDVFHLFVVPVENLYPAAAAPVLCDITRTRYPVRPAEDAPDARVLHSVIAVYRHTKDGREPLMPRHLATGTSFYEFDSAGAGQPELIVRLPESVVDPTVVAIDAHWFQPGFDQQHGGGRIEASLQTRHLDGVNWSVIGGVRPHAGPGIERNTFAILSLLSIRAKGFLSRADLVTIAKALGASKDGYHGGLAEAITEVSAREDNVQAGGGTALRYLYRLTVREVAPEQRPLLIDLLIQLERLLDAWSPHPVAVEIVTSSGGRVTTLQELV
ncbi:MAG: type VI secretion system baseplate subunit TssF [Myxococcota bacterium]